MMAEKRYAMNRIVNQDGYSATFMTRLSVFSEQLIILKEGLIFGFQWVSHTMTKSGLVKRKKCLSSSAVVEVQVPVEKVD